MPTVEELGQKVKAKYPGAYDDLSNLDLGRKVKLKYPGSYDDFTDAPPVPGTEKLGLPPVPSVNVQMQESGLLDKTRAVASSAAEAGMTNVFKTAGGASLTDVYDNAASATVGLLERATGIPRSRMRQDFPAVAFANELVRAVPELGDFLMSPVGAALPAAQKVQKVNALIQAAFATDMASGAKDALKAAYDNPNAETIGTAVKAVGMAVLPWLHAAGTEKKTFQLKNQKPVVEDISEPPPPADAGPVAKGPQVKSARASAQVFNEQLPPVPTVVSEPQLSGKSAAESARVFEAAGLDSLDAVNKRLQEIAMNPQGVSAEEFHQLLKLQRQFRERQQGEGLLNQIDVAASEGGGRQTGADGSGATSQGAAQTSAGRSADGNAAPAPGGSALPPVPRVAEMEVRNAESESPGEGVIQPEGSNRAGSPSGNPPASESRTITTDGNSGTATAAAGQGPSVPGTDRRSNPRRNGSSVVVRIPGDKERAYEGQYAVREADEVNASHNPFNFERNERYQFTNDRDYSDAKNAERIVRQTNEFDPAYLINDSPTAEVGPPIIDSAGNVLGGNSRKMTLDRVYEQRPEAAEAYRQTLIQKAAQFGLDAEEVAGMRRPVLVRELTGEVDAQRTITDLNKTGTASLTSAERALADAKGLTEDTLDFISQRIEQQGPDATLLQALEGKNGVDVVNRLIDDGVITAQERPQYIDERGVLTAEGKQRISRLMLGRIFTSPAEFEATPPEIRNKLERIVPSLARLSGRAEWDLRATVQNALAALEEARAHNLKNLDDLNSQSSLFGEQRWDPEVLAVAKALQGKPTELTKAFRQYAADEALSRPGATGTFFEPPSRQQAFYDAFGAQPKGKSVPGPGAAHRIADAIERKGKSLIAEGDADGFTLGGGLGSLNAPTTKLSGHVLVGVAKIVRGAADFATWSKEMVREFGDTIKPQLQALWTQAQAKADSLKKSGFDVNEHFNFDRINVSPQARADLEGHVIQSVLESGRHPKTVEPLAEVRARAEAAGLTDKQVKEALSAYTKKSPLTRDVVVAARETLNAYTEQRAQILNTLQSRGPAMPPAERAKLEAEADRLMGDISGLLDTIIPARSEAGRNLRIWGYIAQSDKLTVDYWVAEAQKQLGLPRGVEIPEDARKRITDMVGKIRDMKKAGASAKDVMRAQQDLALYMASLQKAGIPETANALRKAGLLTGVKTHARNIGGNLGFQGLEEAARIPASFVDVALSLFTGNRTVEGANPLAMARAGRRAATQGVREAANIMQHGMTSAQSERFELPHEFYSGNKVLDTYVNFVFRSLVAEDQVFRTYALQRSLEERAWLQAKREKGGSARAQELLKNPPESMIAEAIADAEFATFNNKNLFAQEYRKAQRNLSAKGTAGRAAANAMDFIVPFANTPANILARVVDYTAPGAVVRGGHAAWRAFLAGKLSPEQQRTISQAVGRGAVGTGLMMLGWHLASQGAATGVLSSDEGIRAVDEAAKRPASSVMGPDGNWYNIGSFSPTGNLIILGATMQREANRPLTNEALRWDNLLAVAGRTVLEQPMVQGVSTLQRTMENPTRFARSLAANSLGSFVPTFLSDIAAATDENVRFGTASRFTDDILANLRARVPGLRPQLPERFDVLGRPMYENRVQIDPTLSTPVLNEPVTHELVRNEAKINWPDRKRNEPVEEYRMRSQLIGRLIESEIQDMLAEPEYQEAKPGAARRALIAKAVGNARRAVSDELESIGYEDLSSPERIQALAQMTAHINQQLPPVPKVEPSLFR